MLKKPAAVPIEEKRRLKDTKSSSDERPVVDNADGDKSVTMDHASPNNAMKAERALLMAGCEQYLAEKHWA